jgi:hypothetical protein
MHIRPSGFFGRETDETFISHSHFLPANPFLSHHLPLIEFRNDAPLV